MTPRASKQWMLTENETINTFESWKQNIQYVLSLDASFSFFLVEGTTWEKRTKNNAEHRGLKDDPVTTSPTPAARTAIQKVTVLELMLREIANVCPVIERNAILYNSTSIDSIWQMIQAHYGFQTSGCHFLDFANLKLEPGEDHEALYQRLMTFINHNLLRKASGITHHSECVAKDEELSPSLENLIVLSWLRLIHEDLPSLIRQRFSSELRSRTIASIKPEISQVMDSLLDCIRSDEESISVLRTIRSYTLPQISRAQHHIRFRRNQAEACLLCKRSNRPFTHSIRYCSYLPQGDKRFLSRELLVSAFKQEDNDEYRDKKSSMESSKESSPNINLTLSTEATQITKSPFIYMDYNYYTVKLTLDTGSETNAIKQSFAKYINAPIRTSCVTVLQADGTSPLSVKGETTIELNRDDKTFHLEALVVEDIDVNILAGVPFMYENDITVRPAKFQILFADGSSCQYNHESEVDKRPYSVRFAKIISDCLTS